MSLVPALVLTVCLVQQPAVCKDVGIQLMIANPAELQFPYACARAGQLEAQKYTEAFPAWRVTRWKCPKPTKNEEAI